MKEKYEWRASDLIIPILAVFLAFYYLITIRGLPLIAQMYGGSLSIFIIVLSVILFLLVIKNGALKKEKVNIFISEKYRKAIILMILVTTYILIIPFLGYPVTSIIFMTIVMLFLGMKNIAKVVSIAIFVTLLGFSLFILFLNVQLPLDPFSQFIVNLIR